MEPRRVDEDVTVIRECLRAAVAGPFFPEWEFHMLMGLSRAEIAEVLEGSPDRADSETRALAVNNVLNNLLGYPHGCEDKWSDYISVSKGEVAAVFARWRGDGDFDRTSHGHFDPDALIRGVAGGRLGECSGMTPERSVFRDL